MRICLVTPELPPFRYGGIGAYTLTLARGLHRRGCEVDVVGPRLHPDRVVRHDWGRSVSLGGRVRGVANALRYAGKRLGRAPLFWRAAHAAVASQYREGPRLVRDYAAANAGRYDVIETPNYLGLGAYLTDGRTPVIVRLSTPASLSSGANAAVDALEAATFRNASLVISNSHDNDRVCRDHYHTDHENRCVIPHGVEDAPFERRAARPSDKIQLLFVGRADRRKGLDVLLRALHRVLPSNPQLTLSCVGCTLADAEDYLRRQITDSDQLLRFVSQARSSIDFLGGVSEDQKNAALAAADAVTLPSRYESFGLVAIEALRSGTPIVASDVGGLGEIARRCPAAALFENEDDVGLGDFLASLRPGRGFLSEPTRQAARDVFLAEYTPDRMVEKTLVAYRSAINPEAGRPESSQLVGPLPR